MTHLAQQNRHRLPTLGPDFPSPILAAATQLQTFVTTLFRPSDIVELRLLESWRAAEGHKRTKVVKRLWVPAPEIPTAWPTLHTLNTKEAANIYFGVNPRTDQAGTKASVQLIRSIWADFDGIDHAEAQHRWQPHLPAEPSMVVSSGHGVHAYWLLRRPFVIQSESDRERFESMLKGLYESVGCDSVQDVSRVLRLPGFWNVKGLRSGGSPMPCQLIACDPERTYPFATFHPRWQRTKLQTRNVTPESPPTPTHRCDGDARELLFDLDRPVKDRSRRDYAIILAMLRQGLTPAEIWPLVKDKSKFQSRGRNYFDTTVANAQRELAWEA